MDGPATADPIPALLDGRIDLAFCNDRVRDRRLVERPLFGDELVVVMAPTHRLAARPYIQAKDFADETIIIYPPKEDSTLLQKVIVPAGVRPRAITQVQLSEAIIELVKADLGLALMARWVVEPSLRSGAVRGVPLTRKGYHRQWCAVVLRDMAASPFITEFVDLIARRPLDVAWPAAVRASAGSHRHTDGPRLVPSRGKGSARSLRIP